MIRASIENEEYVETPLDINPDNYIMAPDDLQLDVEEKNSVRWRYIMQF